jgi:hypothetical protein
MPAPETKTDNRDTASRRVPALAGCLWCCRRFVEAEMQNAIVGTSFFLRFFSQFVTRNATVCPKSPDGNRCVSDSISS